MPSPMSKSALIESITKLQSDETSKRQVKSVVEALVTVGHKELKKSGVFVVPGFAKFVVVKKPATKARKGSIPSPRSPTVFKAKPARNDREGPSGQGRQGRHRLGLVARAARGDQTRRSSARHEAPSPCPCQLGFTGYHRSFPRREARPASISRDGDDWVVRATIDGKSAREANRTLLAQLRRVERKTRLRSEWTHAGQTERFFDYVPKETAPQFRDQRVVACSVACCTRTDPFLRSGLEGP